MNVPDSLSDELARAYRVDDDDLARLHHQLAAAAAADGVLDVAYRTVDSPVGALLLAATDAGLVRVAFAVEDHDKVLQGLADRISPRVLAAPERLDVVAKELGEYFSVVVTTSTWPWTGGCRPVSAATFSAASATSATATPRRTRAWPGKPATRGRFVPSAVPAPPTRCLWSCRVTACCEPTAPSAVTSAAWTPSGRCWGWKPPPDR